MTDKILNREDGAAAKMLQCSVVTSEVKATERRRRRAHLPLAPCCAGLQRDRRLASSCAQDHNLFIRSPSLRTCLCWSDRNCKESHSMITLVSIVKCSCTMDERSCSEIKIFDRAVFGLVCAHAHSWSSSLATSRLSRWCLQICLC